MTRKPIHRFLPLTYKPKIPRVLAGSISQSIRIDTDLQVGDFIAFHGWEGKPYHSPWSFRTPFMPLTMAMPIHFKKNNTVVIRTGQGSLYSQPDLVDLAARDGIEPATAEELIRVIRSMHGKGSLQGKVLRWDPEPIKNPDPWNDPTNEFQEVCKECQQLTGGGCSGDPIGCAFDALDELRRDATIEQVHATIKESAPLQVPVLTPPGQDFIQIGFCKEVR